MDALMEEKKQPKQAYGMTAPRAPLYEGKGSVLALLTEPDGTPISSNAEKSQSAMKILRHPVNTREAKRLKDISPHHAACITTTKNCIAGLGFMTEEDLNNDGKIDDEEKQKMVSLLTGSMYVKSKVDKALDELTMFGFMNELFDWIEDFLDTGSGYLEVARKGDKITYIGMLPSESVHLVRQGTNLYFQVKEDDGTIKYFSRFGKQNKDWLFTDGPYKNSSLDPDTISEIIYLPMPSNRCRYYGYPYYLAASTDIDLLKKAKQYKADFYHNRGVLDFILSVTGDRVSDNDWEVITSKISGTSGEGNNWKSLGMNLPGENAKVQVDKLAADMGTEEQYAKDNEVFSQNIVSAHGVPPLLANILIPGKLGASNEFANSLLSFQLLRIHPLQNIIQKVLADTLGNPELNGGLGLKENDFRFRVITSQINMQVADTVGRMREEVSTSGDRDLEEGVKD